MRYLALAFALLAACSSVETPSRCTPGASVACVCPGGGAGGQACAADGESYGACVCGVDAGTGPADAVDVALARDVVECSPGASTQCTCSGTGALGVRTCDASAQWGRCLCGAVLDAGSEGAADVVVAPDVVADASRCPVGPVTTCDGRRVSVRSGERDGGVILHCGQCGNTCPVPEGSSWRHTGAFCEDCACIVDCVGDYRDCDGNPANGCEALFGDINNCGACGRRCAAGQRCVGAPPRCEY